MSAAPQVQRSVTVSEALGRGWSIIPVGRNKVPLVKHWKPYQERRPTPNEITNWETMRPPAWAVVTGKISGIITLDFDGEAGRKTLELLHLKPHRSTPSGGFHVDFIHPGWKVPTLNGKAKRALGEKWRGLDIRGDGGYVLFRGRTDKGQYHWIGAHEPYSLDTLPRELREFLGLLNPPKEPKAQASGAAPAELDRCNPDLLIGRALERAAREGRNNAGFWLCGQLRDNRYPQPETEVLMREYAARCPITNTKGQAEPYSDHEITATVREVFSRVPRDPWKQQFFDAKPRVIPLPAPLEKHAFYGLAGEWSRIVEPHTEADLAAILTQFLVGFGNLIGHKPYFRVAGDEHHMNLFMVLVGLSSKARKGTSWGQTRIPLRKIDENWAQHCIKSGLSTGEGLIHHVRDESPATSKEGDTKRDPGVQDKRLLIIESEFGRVLQVCARDGNTLSAVLRQAWDNDILSVLTKKDAPTATWPHISIIGHITIIETRKLLSELSAANGYANRFLWVYTKRVACLPLGGELRRVNLEPFLERLEQATAFARKTEEIRLDSDATEYWCTVYPDLSEGEAGVFGAVVNRAEAQAMRLACLYALLDCSEVIHVEHMQAALAVWKYCKASAEFIFGHKLGDALADEILEALRDHPAGMTRNDLYDYFDRHRRGTEIAQSLLLLEELKRARCEKESTSGRPAERWFTS
jgi:bifunctional DNA primase/polymerase-like protein/uncharacterized protein DUF3987